MGVIGNPLHYGRVDKRVDASTLFCLLSDMLKKNLLLLFLIFTVSALWADYNPRTKWKEITSDHFHIVYDEVLEEDVIKVIETLEGLFDLIAGDMGGKIDRYTIVLPSGIYESNGYVSTAGAKSVFYSQPPATSFAGNMDWYNLLAIHEARHMVQFTRLRDTLLQKILHILYGDLGFLPTFFLTPTYFFEGDAVLTETLLSNSGRGRSPGFEMKWRTALLSGREYSFPKVFHGSDKEYIPSPYVLGYYLMTHLKREAGAERFERIAAEAANIPLPMNFSISTILNKQGSMPNLYQDVAKELTELWSRQDENVTPTETEKVKVTESGYKHYFFPHYDTEGNLLYLYDDIQNSTYLVRETGDEEEIFKSINTGFSLNDSRLVYTKSSSHPRWTYEEYSDIYTYDLDKREEFRLTKKGRFSSPVFSNDGSYISAVDYALNRSPVIRVLSTKSGDVQAFKEFTDSEFIRDLTYGEDDDTLYFVVYRDDEAALTRYDFNSDKLEYLSEFSNVEIMDLEYADGVLYYVSSQSGIYDIYAYDINNNINNRVISSRFGCKNPHVYENRLYFNQYTEFGYNIEYVNLDSLQPEADNEVENNHVDYFQPLLKDVTYDTNDVEYEIDSYNPYLNLLNFHSWALTPNFTSDDELAIDYYDLRFYSSDHHELLDLEMIFMLSHSLDYFLVGSIGSFDGFYPKISWVGAYYSYSDDPAYYDNLELEIPLTFNDVTISYLIGENHSYNKDVDDEHYLSLYNGFSVDYAGQSLSVDNEVTYQFDLMSADDQILSNTFELEWGRLTITNDLDFSMVWQYNQTPDSLWNDDEGYQSLLESSLEFGGTILNSEWSIFNGLYIDDFELYGGYSSLYTSSETYDQYIWGKVAMGYYIFRTAIKFKSEFVYYYDPVSGDHFPNFDGVFTISY